MAPTHRFRSVLVASATALIAVACGSTEPVKSPAAPALTLSFPATVIAPGQEDTRCVVVRLGNDKALHVGAIHNALGDASHHLIVYRVNDTEEQRTPLPCSPFVDTLNPDKGSPLMVTQKKDDQLTLPSGVGFSLEAHQMIRIEMHFLNASSVDKTVSATTTFTPISDDDFRDEAGFLFIGNPDIQLPPKAETTLGPTFFELPSDLSGVSFFAVTGHEHRLGTNVTIASVANAADPGTSIYDVPNWSWSEPKTEVFDKPLTIPDGGGFKFTCSWNNVTDRQVGFGESATDEMCFFWAYYYPNRGSLVCVHTSRIGGAGGGDICCPGHGLCTFVEKFLSGR